MKKIRLMIADDCPIVRQGLRTSFADQHDIELIAEANDGEEAVNLAASHRPDVLITEMTMPGSSGKQLISKILRHASETAVVVFTMRKEEEHALPALQAGAQGFVHKMRPVKELIRAVRQVAEGEPFVSNELAQRLAVATFSGASRTALHNSLSHREREVFLKLANGQSVSNIAEHLHLSPKTVSTHKTRILRKLGLSNTYELVRYAIDHDLLWLAT